ncbi:MAG: acetyl-CoA carboxylase biotin carboxyl carrier protein subunit [Christensenellales bacterium]
MNIKQLKEIIRLFEQSSLTMLDLSEGEERVRLRRAGPAPQPGVPVPAPMPGPAPLDPADAGTDFSRLVEVKAPVVGICYEAPEPGGTPFIRVGDRVKKGDVLCLIEVMKQITEVTAPQDGQVADICLESGSLVEYGQTLVKLC